MSTHRVELPGGAITHVEQWGDAGPALVCVHGITSSRIGWRRFAERFADRHRVYAYDQRGHGDSAAIVGPMSLADNVADLHAVVASIAPPVLALVGHSWGGAVVILGGRLIAVPKVIAIDPVIVAPTTFREDYVESLRADLALPWPERERVLRERFPGMDPLDWAGKIHAVRDMRVESIENLGRDNAVERGGWDLRETLRDYPKPLFIAMPDVADSTVDEGEREFIAAHAGPMVATMLFEGAGHSIHRTQLDKLAHVIDRFLEPAAV